MARVLVTDGEQRSSLAAVRSLGSAGHVVHVCSARDRPLAGASRHCRAVHRVRDPQTSPTGFQADIDAIVGEHRIEVVFPMTDSSAPLILDIRDRWAGVAVPFPERQLYERLSNKRELLEVAATLGVPVPRQHVIESSGALDIEEAIDWASAFDHSVILKPARSAVWTRDGVSKFSVHLSVSKEDMADHLAAWPQAAYPILIQERIDGPGAGVFMLADGGRTVAAFAHRRIREKPPTGGVSVYRESAALAPELRAHAEAVLGAFDWSGVAMVEFKLDGETGTPYLMEVNARFWGSLQLAIDAGVDFPAILADVALGRRPVVRTGYRVGIRSRWFWGDVDHLLWMLRAPASVRRAHGTLPGRLSTIAAVAIPWRPGDRLEVASFDDPRPFFRESWQWFEGVLG